MKPILTAAAVALSLALVPDPASAQDEDKPSFDCAKAATAAEKAICAQPALGRLDATLARYYRALLARLEAAKAPAQRDQVRRDQAAWLKGRDAPCLAASSAGRNAVALGACLERAYKARLVALAAMNDRVSQAEGAPAPGWSGEYRRMKPPAARTDGGMLFLLHWPDGTFTAEIETVSGPTHHTCAVAMAGMRPAEGRLSWRARNGDETCVVTIAVSGKSARVTADQCAYYCGARGYFDGEYRRP